MHIQAAEARSGPYDRPKTCHKRLTIFCKLRSLLLNLYIWKKNFFRRFWNTIFYFVFQNGCIFIVKKTKTKFCRYSRYTNRGKLTFQVRNTFPSYSSFSKQFSTFSLFFYRNKYKTPCTQRGHWHPMCFTKIVGVNPLHSSRGCDQPIKFRQILKSKHLVDFSLTLRQIFHLKCKRCAN